MADQKAPPGKVLTASLQTIYTNPSNSGVRETLEVRFNNIDGTNDAAITACNWIDASNSNLALAIVPVNAAVAAQDGISILKLLDPGDSIQASASAANDVVAIPEVIAAEPV